MTGAEPAHRTRARVFAVSLASVLLLLVAAELVLRAAGLPREEPAEFLRFQEANEHEARRDLLRADAERVYSLAPHYRSSPEHPGAYATGEWPWRGRPAFPAPPGTRRVVVLGDSCVYGVGVETADTLPERLARALAERGHGPAGVQVLNLGVPGYSSHQVARVLEWALEELEPVAAVFYTSAWNDQAPALAVPDAQVLAGLRAPGFLERSALVGALRRVARDDARLALPYDEIVARWEAGDPPFGTRLAADEVEGVVRGMLARCRERGCAPLVVVPAHPAETIARHPRLLDDRASLRRAAAGEALLDAPELVVGAADFVDFVHPSPAFWDACAPPIADFVAEALGQPRAAPAGGLRVAAVEPAVLPTFGGELTVELEGWRAGDALPAVVVGGAPLLDPEPAGESAVRGTVATNAPGPQPVLVQSEGGSSVRAGALELRAPWFEEAAGELLLHGRPGDRAGVSFGAALDPDAVWTPNGRCLLAASEASAERIDVEVGDDGVARIALPAELRAAREATLYVQALVVPRGESAPSPEARWSEVFELRVGGR